MLGCRTIAGRRRRQRCAWAASWLVVAAVACDGRVSEGPAVIAEAAAPRPVRVLISDGADEVRLHVASAFECIAAGGAPARFPAMASAELLHADAGRLRFLGDDSIVGPLTIVPQTGGAITLAARYGPDWSLDFAYPGSITLRADSKRIRIINEVDLETYVACVVACEVWPGFHDETFRVQAVAVRSYALDQMRRGLDRPYDVYAGPASQVYRGLRDDAVGRRAQEAAAATLGVVCTWRANGAEAVLPTFYSAACGGVTQSSAVFNGSAPPTPLAGGIQCSGCQTAPDGTYRWGTVEIGVDDAVRLLRQRLTAAADLTGIRALRISRQSESGRALEVTLTDDAGRSFPIGVEDFRLALNGMTVRSTFCTITLAGDVIRFSDGRGFGHGVGLCQWGAEAQARAGRTAGQILRFYFPGARLSRAY